MWIGRMMKKILYFVFVVLRGQNAEANKLWYCFAELLPTDGIIKGLRTMEFFETQIACKTVALCFATVNQEFGFVIKPDATTDTHAIFVIFHIFFVRFAIFQLMKEYKDETFVAIIIATGIAALDTRVKGSFIRVVSSIVKPHRSHHLGSRSHLFVRSFVRSFVLRVCC